MLDLYFLGGAMLFFALMLVYVAAVDKLGTPAETAQGNLPERAS